jgi:hypothetical protein
LLPFIITYEMEPEVRQFFQRIGYSIAIALVWLIVNVTAAIKGDNAFIGDHVSLANVLFYCWFIVSVVLLLWFYKRLWSKHLGDHHIK